MERRREIDDRDKGGQVREDEASINEACISPQNN